jgi:hypothetical protein
MKNFDPTAPLLDAIVEDGQVTWFAAEEPRLRCPCEGTGWIGNEWLFFRPSHCTCEVEKDDFDAYLHDVSCDAVPCPFCPLEESP